MQFKISSDSPSFFFSAHAFFVNGKRMTTRTTTTTTTTGGKCFSIECSTPTTIQTPPHPLPPPTEEHTNSERARERKRKGPKSIFFLYPAQLFCVVVVVALVGCCRMARQENLLLFFHRYIQGGCGVGWGRLWKGLWSFVLQTVARQWRVCVRYCVYTGEKYF